MEKVKNMVMKEDWNLKENILFYFINFHRPFSIQIFFMIYEIRILFLEIINFILELRKKLTNF